MHKIISKMPVGITMEFTSRKLTHANIGGFATASFFAPCNTDFGSELSDVFVILKVSPKFNPGAGFFFDNLTNYGDGWCDVPPGAAPDY